MYIPNHLTQTIRSDLSLSFSLSPSVRYANIIYRTSVVIYIRAYSLSRYNVRIYVSKHLTETICSGLSLSLTLVTPYKIRAQNLDTGNIFVSHSASLRRMNTCIYTLNREIYFVLDPHSLSISLTLECKKFMYKLKF